MKTGTTVNRHATRQSTTWLLPVVWLLLTICGTAVAEEQGGGAVPNPGIELWRAVREGPPPGVSRSQVEGIGMTTLIAEGGERWRQLRSNYVAPWGGWALVGMLGVLTLFHLVRKSPERFDGSSGKVIVRFPDYDRILHWFMAGTFLFLAISGLILLLGRHVILPLVGPQAFGAIASASKEGHNLFGPVFIVSLTLFVLRFAQRNFFARGDLAWLAKGGGMLSGKHVSAGFFNAGEKILFWSITFGGLAISISGLILVFPLFGQSRELMQLMLLVHGIAALVLIAFTFGHMYLGSIGLPGSFNAMNTGKVDADWAHAHHDRWHREAEEKGLIEKAPS